MRKILTTISILSIVLVPAVSFAAGYSRSPSGSPIYGTIHITITGSDLYDITQDYQANSYKLNFGNGLLSPCMTDAGSFDLTNVPLGSYTVVSPINVYGKSDCTSPHTNTWAMTVSDSFTVIKAPQAPIIVPIAPDFSSKITANVGDQLGDTGTLAVLALVAGIPLSFYVIHQLVALVPRRRKGRNQ